MYSLLLVDDEPSILNGLYQNVDWDELGIASVYKAGLAADALAIIAKHHIDIVITDIRMPEMDGVQLAKVIRKNWPFTKLIFLTGHQDFAYAQTAVDLGVFRYMLKPVLYKDIVEVVREAIGVLEQALAGAARVRDMEEKLRYLRPALRERSILRWLELGDLQLLDNPGEYREYEIPLQGTDWGFLLAVKADGAEDTPQDGAIRHLTVRGLAESILYPDGGLLDYSNLENHSILVFLRENEAGARALLSRVIQRLEPFQYALSEALGRPLTIFWTPPAPAGQLHTVYAALKGRMERYIALVPGGIIGPDSHSGAEPGLESLSRQPTLAACVRGLHRQDVRERLLEIFAELEEKENQSQLLLLQVYHEITGALVADSLHRGLPLSQWAGEHLDFFESMSSVRTLEQFRDTSLAVADRYMEHAVSSSLTQAGNLVALVQAAVREDLSREITVASLAEQFSYHPNYLSRLFKQETDLSLQEFIIGERMDAAKRLLAEGLRVGDAARQVGYDSVAHFSRLFKKVTGLGPKQYQMGAEQAGGG